MTIVPPCPDLIMARAAERADSHVPLRFTSMMTSKSSSLNSCPGPCFSMPAHVTIASRSPKRRERFFDHVVARRSIAHVHLDRDRIADLRRRALGGCGIDVGADHAVAAF